MRILALDLALGVTGVAHDGGAERLRAHRLDGPGRLAFIRDAILIRVDLLGADLVVLEEPFIGRQARTGLLELLGVHAVVRVALWEHAIPYAVIAQAALKRYATGKGNASKEDVHGAAIKRLGYAGASRDEADALWLLEMARAHYTPAAATPVPAAHRAALAGVAWPDLPRTPRLETVSGGELV